MKNRNPLFVAAFPYVTISLGYFVLVIWDAANEDSDSLSSGEGLVLLVFFVMLLAGLVYTLYWLVSTARVLRRETTLTIPNSFLVVVPIANYWWMWRYSQATEVYLKEKQQSALIFLLIAALGSIGMGIVQDYFNKLDQSAPKTAN